MAEFANTETAKSILGINKLNYMAIAARGLIDTCNLYVIYDPLAKKKLQTNLIINFWANIFGGPSHQ